MTDIKKLSESDPAPIGSTEIAVEGTIQERKFESNVARIYTQAPGESKLRAVVIGLLSLPLIPLIALSDVVRYGLFTYGTLDGKSFSLIDKASEAIRNLAGKVQEVAEKAELTPEDLDAQAELAMKQNVALLVRGYLDLNGGLFRTNSSFSSPKALAGERKILEAQRNLVQIMSECLGRNVSSSQDFASRLATVRNYIANLIKETAGEEFFVANKIKRKERPDFLYTVAFKELVGFMATTGQPVIAQTFLKQVEADYQNDAAAQIVTAGSKLAQNLAEGVTQQIITQAQAREVVEQHARPTYVQVLETQGPKTAQVALNDLLNEAVNSELVTSVEADFMDQTIRMTPEELAASVVKSVIEYKVEHPTAKPAALDQKISQAAQALKEQHRLAPEEVIVFLNAAKDLLVSLKKEIEQKVEAAIQARQEAAAAAALKTQEERDAAAALEAKQAEEAAQAAEQAAAIQKATEDRQNLFDLLKALLAAIAGKQAELVQKYSLYSTQSAERDRLATELMQTVGAEVAVGKNQKKMTVLEATEYHARRIAEISRSKQTPADQAVERAQFERDFGSEAIEIIGRMHTLYQALDRQTQLLDETLKDIESRDAKLGVAIATYKKLASGEKKRLDQEQRKEIKTLETGVYEAQSGIRTRFREAHYLNPFATLASEKAKAVTGNVQDFLNQLVSKESASQAVPSMSQKLWTGFTAPVRYIARAVGVTA